MGDISRLPWLIAADRLTGRNLHSRTHKESVTPGEKLSDQNEGADVSSPEHSRPESASAPSLISRLIGRTKRGSGGRNTLTLVDTAINALTGVLVVIGAARALDPAHLADFALAQVVATLSIGIIRAAFYSPAMAAQRSSGRAHIPMRWAFTISVATAIPLASGLGLFLPQLSSSPLAAVGVILVVVFTLFCQDGLRAVLISRELPRYAVIADSLTLALIATAVLGGFLPPHALGVLGIWGGAVGVAFAITLVAVLKTSSKSTVQQQSMRNAWRLGRWAALDAIFATTAYLLPMFVATLYIGTNAAGTYRVLQTALGPLNILQTTIVTILGLDSWRTTSKEGLDGLRKLVWRLAGALLVVSALSAAVGLPIMVYLSNLNSENIWRICLIVAAHGIMTAVTTPFMAASFSLGYQRFGVTIRLIALAGSLLVSLPIAGYVWLPYSDPIGVALLFSASVTLIGWVASYRVADRRERRREIDEDQPTATVTE